MTTIPFKFHEKEDISLLVGIVFITKEVFNLIDKKREEIFDSDELKIWEAFHIPFNLQLKLITDDSFTFSSVLKLVEKTYESLPLHTESEGKLVQLFEKMTGIYSMKGDEEKEDNIGDDYSIIFKELDNYVSSLKRGFIFDCLKQIFPLHKMKWASSSINNLFKKIYLEK